METREYVEYLLKNYNGISKDIEQLKFEHITFKGIEPNEVKLDPLERNILERYYILDHSLC